MNEEQYRSLCEACDQVLLDPGSTPERVAIPWLHVIREHPVFLATYSDLFEPSRWLTTIAGQPIRLIRNQAASLRQMVRALRSDGRLWFATKELPKAVDVLFVSHLLTEAQAGQTDDFYFGDLPNKLAEQGQSVIIALINHTGDSGARLVGQFDTPLVPRLILSSSMGLSDDFILHRLLVKESLQLSKLARMEPTGLMRNVLARASEEALANGARTALRLGKQIGALVAKLKPKAVIVTYEGHAWERIACAAARSSHPSVLCIGYQHAALFRLQHAVRRSLEQKYNPDQILTAGNVAKAQLDSEPGLAGISISVLGSSRAKSGNERRLTASRWKEDHSEIAARSACLVVPEGILSECHLLFEFALDCASLCPDTRFILRLHPLITYNNLAHQNRKLRHLPNNVVVSSQTLSDDIAQCRWVLYRGSTAAIQAVAAGAQPIYLELRDEMTIDPLYDLGEAIARIETPMQFLSVIQNINPVRPVDRASNPDGIRQYCHEFYEPFHYEVIHRIIKETQDAKVARL